MGMEIVIKVQSHRMTDDSVCWNLYLSYGDEPNEIMLETDATDEEGAIKRANSIAAALRCNTIEKVRIL